MVGRRIMHPQFAVQLASFINKSYLYIMKKFIPITNYINLGGKLDLLDPLNEVLFAKPSDKNHHQRVVKVELENHSVPTYTVHFENGDKGDYPENCLEVQVNMMLDKKYLGRAPLAEFTNKLHSLGYENKFHG